MRGVGIGEWGGGGENRQGWRERGEGRKWGREQKHGVGPTEVRSDSY